MSDSKSKTTKGSTKKKIARGPKPDTLIIKGDWKDAVKRSFSKTKPKKAGPSRRPHGARINCFRYEPNA